jgi:hypothetical protein
MRRGVIWTVGATILLAVAFCSTGRSRLYRNEVFIDVMSGRFREDVYVCWLPIRQKVSASWVAEALGPRGKEDWRFVSATAFGREFPDDSKFSSARATLSRADAVFTTFGVAQTDRERIAAEIVQIWQQDGMHSRADRHLRSVLSGYIEHYDIVQRDAESDAKNRRR